MAKHTVRLLNQQPIALRTLAFELEKPDGFTFKPGQFIHVTLLNPAETDAEGNTRSLSLASAPGDDRLMIATRMRDTAYKRVLHSLPPGTEVAIKGPFGNFTLHSDMQRPAVMIAGGIGITPFRGMVRRVVQEKLPYRMFLFYSNRRAEDAAFLDELQTLAAGNPNFTFVPVMTAVDGHLSVDAIHARVGDVAPVYYVVGPPAMSDGMRGALEAAGIGDDDIRAEEFGGY